MLQTKIRHEGRVFYTTHPTAKRLGISDRTLLRWIEWLDKGHRPAELLELRWFKHPINGINYFQAISVRKTKKLLAAATQIRPNGHTR